MSNSKQLVAIKYTYALEAHGGFWLAFSDRTTEYVTAVPRDLWSDHKCTGADAVRHPGMWQRTYLCVGSVRDAWNEWKLV